MYNLIMENDLKKQLIKYFKTLGIEVYTNTKARGHQGFFLNGRIDISKNTKEERIVPTLLHEFAHYIHAKIEPDMAKTGGSLDVLFDANLSLRGVCKAKDEAIQGKDPQKYVILNLFQDLISERPCDPEMNSGRRESSSVDLSTLQNELLTVTHFVDENSLCHKFHAHKEQVKKKINVQENIIKEDYPKFMRSKKFKEFDKYIKKSKAKYLLRYDRVKFVSPGFLNMLKKVEIFTIDNLERDFPEMPRAFCAYIRLKSAQKKQARISARINSLNKYYSKPTELFARLVEGLYLDEARTRAFAPQATQVFFELLDNGYYRELKNVFELLKENKLVLRS